MEERRKARRFNVEWNIVVKGSDKLGTRIEEFGSLVNLSSRGAFLRLPRYFAVGSKLEVWIRTPLTDERWIVYSGEVVRCENGTPEAYLGMKFTKIRPKLTDIF